ncbi:MAG TPA: four helix bundle protein [Chloroflexota bacterium]|nr:four helix bundle protein [Chloroflexota bacterium]
MAPSRRFDDVALWKKAHAWVLQVYKFTEAFPRAETFGLSAQLRRAAVSIPANFAEGFKKFSAPEKARFYNIAQGSLEECRYYLILARDLGYGDTEELRDQLDEIGRMLDAYCKRTRG